MVLVLDTDRLPARDRAEAVAETMRAAGVTAHVTHHDPHALQARMSLWAMDGGVNVLYRSSSGLRLTQTTRQARVSGRDRVSLSVLSPGRWRYSQGRHAEGARSGASGMVLTDHSTAYEFARSDLGETRAVNIEREALGLPVDVIRSAVGRLASSPVYDLARRHLEQLSRDADRIPAGPAATMVGTATIELVRAVITTAADDDAWRAAALADTLPTRIAVFVQQNLRDPGLTPGRIAREHDISVRHLYKVWSEREMPLAEWIMGGRLAAARRELARPDARTRTISSVARGCGFVDAAHFTRRFRRAYGLSPREWRQLQDDIRAPGPGRNR